MSDTIQSAIAAPDPPMIALYKENVVLQAQFILLQSIIKGLGLSRKVSRIYDREWPKRMEAICQDIHERNKQAHADSQPRIIVPNGIITRH